VQRNRAKAVHNYGWRVARDGTKTFLRPFLKKEGREWIQWVIKIKVVREANQGSPNTTPEVSPLRTTNHMLSYHRLFVKSERGI
jgi:hypothetical protein